jgi:hypothetical protein
VESSDNEGEHELIVANDELDPFDSEQQCLTLLTAVGERSGIPIVNGYPLQCTQIYYFRPNGDNQKIVLQAGVLPNGGSVADATMLYHFFPL